MRLIPKQSSGEKIYDLNIYLTNASTMHHFGNYFRIFRVSTYYVNFYSTKIPVTHFYESVIQRIDHSVSQYIDNEIKNLFIL